MRSLAGSGDPGECWLPKQCEGRLNQPAAELARRYNESVSFDWRLYRYDIAGSIAHAAALARAGIITAGEREQIENELREIESRSSPANSNRIAQRRAIGAPSPENIAAQIKGWKGLLAEG